MRTTSTLPTSDRTLLARSADGDLQSFAELYDRYQSQIFAYCERVMGSHDEAGDATQETFIRLMDRVGQLELQRDSVRPYLLTVARNVCFDLMARRRRGELVDDMPAQWRSLHAEEQIEDQDPARVAMLQAHRRVIQDAAGGLPDRYREVLQLREVDELSYEEIGERIGLNDNAVAQLIWRARHKLNVELRKVTLRSFAHGSGECKVVMARIGDKAPNAAHAAHLDDCDSCRLAWQSVQEVGMSHRVEAGGVVVGVLLWARDAWANVWRAARRGATGRGGRGTMGALGALALLAVFASSLSPSADLPVEQASAADKPSTQPGAATGGQADPAERAPRRARSDTAAPRPAEGSSRRAVTAAPASERPDAAPVAAPRRVAEQAAPQPAVTRRPARRAPTPTPSVVKPADRVDPVVAAVTPAPVAGLGTVAEAAGTPADGTHAESPLPSVAFTPTDPTSVPGASPTPPEGTVPPTTPADPRPQDPTRPTCVTCPGGGGTVVIVAAGSTTTPSSGPIG